MFQYVDRIGDWSKWQVVALFGTHQLIAQIFQSLFFVNLSELPELVRTGKLDLLLVLPVDAQFAVSTKKFGIDNMVNAVVGCVIVGFALGKLHYLPGPGQIALYAIAVCFGVAIHYGVLMMLSLLSFWIVRAQGIVYGYFNLFNIGRYPDVVFHGVFKTIFSFVIPIILVSNVPVRLLTNSAASPALALLSMAGATLLVVVLCRGLWHIALRRYSSASS